MPFYEELMQVPKSKGLYDKIVNNIDKMFADRLTYARDWANYGMPYAQIEATLRNELYTEEQLQHINALGPKFFTELNELVFQIPNGGKNPSDFKVTFPAGWLIPNHWTGYYGAKKFIAKSPEIRALAERRGEAIFVVKKSIEDFKDTFETVWEKASSVNQIDKAWPAIRDLLPADIIIRLDTKVTREKIEHKALDELKELSIHHLKAKVAA